jgi:hypothetical protein
MNWQEALTLYTDLRVPEADEVQDQLAAVGSRDDPPPRQGSRPTTSRASPQPDDACLLGLMWVKGLRSELDVDTLCHVDDRLMAVGGLAACA